MMPLTEFQKRLEIIQALERGAPPAALLVIEEAAEALEEEAQLVSSPLIALQQRVVEELSSRQSTLVELTDETEEVALSQLDSLQKTAATCDQEARALALRIDTLRGELDRQRALKLSLIASLKGLNPPRKNHPGIEELLSVCREASQRAVALQLRRPHGS